jgi:hypothetical protein
MVFVAKPSSRSRKDLCKKNCKSILASIVFLVILSFFWIFIDVTTREVFTAENVFDALKLESRAQSTESNAADAGGKFRFDWENLPPQSELAKRMMETQENCSLPLSNFYWRNEYGIGSDFHLWALALCNSVTARRRVRTSIRNGDPWIFRDVNACDNGNYSSMSRNIKPNNKQSSLACYFPKSELLCQDDAANITTTKLEYTWNGEPKEEHNITDTCTHLMNEQGYSVKDVEAAATEFLFRSVSPIVVEEAKRQLKLFFAPNNGIVPPNLITVHIRWGDKVFVKAHAPEMRVTSIKEYIGSVQHILNKREDNTTANIYLATEDPKAVKAFEENLPSNWNLYVDQYYHDMLPYRSTNEAVYNQNPITSKLLKGRAGLVAIGSLLVAMEANDFVLTTQSNWSRLIDELRKNVLDARCNECTDMIDIESERLAASVNIMSRPKSM